MPTPWMGSTWDQDFLVAVTGPSTWLTVGSVDLDEGHPHFSGLPNKIGQYYIYLLNGVCNGAREVLKYSMACETLYSFLETLPLLISHLIIFIKWFAFNSHGYKSHLNMSLSLPDVVKFCKHLHPIPYTTHTHTHTLHYTTNTHCTTLTAKSVSSVVRSDILNGIRALL